MKNPDARRGELAEAVFRSVYRSRPQSVLRFLAGAALTTKHTLRGLLFSWPVYALAVAGWFSEGWLQIILWSLAIPAIGLSLVILFRGIREEYHHRVFDRLLSSGDVMRLFGKTGP